MVSTAIELLRIGRILLTNLWLEAHDVRDH
jgi:hypothetical protein